MKRKINIILGILLCLIFLSIIKMEYWIPYQFGISKGTITEFKFENNSCFGEEYDYSAIVQLSINQGKNIPIKVEYLANLLKDKKSESFLYWGYKSDIKNPIDINIVNPSNEYYSNVNIIPFSIENNYAWLYTLYLFIKWFCIIAGLILIYLNYKK